MHKEKPYGKPVEVPSKDFDGSRPGIQGGPSKRDIAWLMIRRGLKITTAVALELAGRKLIGIGGVGVAYAVVEKGTNEAIKKKTGKINDVDPLVGILDLIVKLIRAIWNYGREGGEKDDH